MTKHPHIWRLIDLLSDEEFNFLFRLNHIIALNHEFDYKRRSKTKYIEQQLADIKAAYEAGRLTLDQHLDMLCDFAVGKKK